MRQSDHPWRRNFAGFAEELVEKLANDPETLAAGERLKAEVDPRSTDLKRQRAYRRSRSNLWRMMFPPL
jgi:hypothetical protein